jgi:hypothetical protein
MNAALWKAHLENQQLRAENKRLKERTRRTGLRDCIYCGRPTLSRLSACHAHRDLPALDASYAVR